MSIPRIIHRIWLGPDAMPREFEEYGETWARLHPDWEMRLWTEDSLPEVRWREIHDTSRTGAERADILRYELLLRFGGVYVDADFECRRAIDSLIRDIDFFAGENAPHRVANGIIGAVPDHP